MGKEEDYKVVSDGSRVNFSLNLRWLIGIAVPIIGFVGYLLLDKYFIAPMEDLKKENTELREKDDTHSKTIKTLNDNMLIVLERTERTQKDVDYIRAKVDGTSAPQPVIPIQSTNGPGQ